MHDIAQTSQELSNFRREIYTSAENGEKIAAEASQAMFETEAQIKQLSISCESIEDIVSIIGEISEQTKNLALNATIEAARAGEAGKGFAVVANEVKDLAKQTGEATENIVETINAMRQSTESTSQRIHRVGEVVGKQTESSIPGTMQLRRCFSMVVRIGKPGIESSKKSLMIINMKKVTGRILKQPN